MIAVFDAGNSKIKCVLYDQEQIQVSFAFPYPAEEMTSSAVFLALEAELTVLGYAVSSIRRFVISGGDAESSQYAACCRSRTLDLSRRWRARLAW